MRSPRRTVKARDRDKRTSEISSIKVKLTNKKLENKHSRTSNVLKHNLNPQHRHNPNHSLYFPSLAILNNNLNPNTKIFNFNSILQITPPSETNNLTPTQTKLTSDKHQIKAIWAGAE